MKSIRLIVYVTILLLTLSTALNVYHHELKKNEYKRDLIELSKIKYGLFNVDEWKSTLAEIVAKKIQELNLDERNKEVMRDKIVEFLSVQIRKMEVDINDNTTKSIGGFFDGVITKSVSFFDKLEGRIPEIADDIIYFLEQEENREGIKKYISDQINDYADSTFSQTDYSSVKLIIDRYEQKDMQKAKDFLELKIDRKQTEMFKYKAMLIILAFLSLIMLLMWRETTNIELILFLSISTVFLFLGLLLPMIEIDARITEMVFKLLGEDIGFYNQVLYYKSKSILEVVQLMMMQNRMDLMAVGMLVLTFSVLFPLSKLICSVIYLLKEKSRNHRFVKFMVFKSGKWSMADVMVIAIFMAYIGFDGIISEQLRQIQTLTQHVDFLTTNKSSLLFGFYAFTSFVLLSLGVSYKIQGRIKAQYH